MADIGAEIAWAAETHLRIHVRPIHIHLALGTVHDLADFTNAFFEYTVRGGIGDHEGGKSLPMLLGLGSKVGYIYVPMLITSHGHHAEPRQHRACRICAMRGDRDQADIALGL